MFEKVKELIGKLKPQNEKSVRLLEEAKAELREMVDVCVIRDVPSCGFCDLIAHKARIETLETINAIETNKVEHLEKNIKEADFRCEQLRRDLDLRNAVYGIQSIYNSAKGFREELERVKREREEYRKQIIELSEYLTIEELTNVYLNLRSQGR
jgi:uncharacterized coiled-coil DUF342 family protein